MQGFCRVVSAYKEALTSRGIRGRVNSTPRGFATTLAYVRRLPRYLTVSSAGTRRAGKPWTQYNCLKAYALVAGGHYSYHRTG